MKTFRVLVDSSRSSIPVFFTTIVVFALLASFAPRVASAQSWGSVSGSGGAQNRATRTPASPTTPALPMGVRFAIDVPLFSYASFISGGSGSETGFRLSGGALELGYAPSPVVTIGASLGVDYRSAGDESAVAASFVGFVDVAPGESATRFFIRPHFGGTTSPTLGGWLFGVRLGARVLAIGHVTVEPWAELRYSRASTDVMTLGPRGEVEVVSLGVGVASIALGLSVALWGETSVAAGGDPDTGARGEDLPRWGSADSRSEAGAEQQSRALGPQRPRAAATPSASTGPAPVVAQLRAGPLTVSVIGRPRVERSVVAIAVTRERYMQASDAIDQCREARFLADAELIATVPLAPAGERRLAGRMPAGRIRALVRAARLTLDLCGQRVPLSGAGIALNVFVARFERDGGVVDEAAADVAPEDAPPPADSVVPDAESATPAVE